MLVKKFLSLCFLFTLFCLIVPRVYAEETIEITIQEKDTVIGLANKLLERPAAWREVAKINKLKNPNRIYPGNTLLIPVRLLRGVPYLCKVAFVKGEAARRGKGEATWQPLHLNDQIGEGSMVKTGGGESAAELRYDDGATLFLRPNATLNVVVSKKKSESLRDRRFFIEAGKVISNVKSALGAESRFEIHTPSAIAGVKGTEFRTSVDPVDSTRSEVLGGVVQVEAMRMHVDVLQGEGTVVKKGEPPLPPVKLLPPPRLLNPHPVYKSLPHPLQFERVEGAVAYRIMLAKDSAIKDVVKEHVIKPEERFLLEGVQDSTYYMRSQSIDALGLEGPGLEPVAIKVRVNPLPPFIQAPPEGEEIHDKIVAIRWLRVKDAEGYHLQIAEDREFKTLREDRTHIKETEYKTEPLDFKTYYFKVSSIAADGYEGAWSDPVSFRVVPPPPAPSVEKPALDEKEIQMRWQDLGKGVTYHFQMAKDSEFTQILIDKRLDTPAIRVPKLQEPGTYYVRTSSIDAKGYEGNFSPPQSFEIKAVQRPPYEVLVIIGGIALILLLAL